MYFTCTQASLFFYWCNVLARAVKAKLLRLESYNKELESMDVFKSNGSPGPEEMDSKSKRASVVMLDRKDASKLRDVSTHYGYILDVLL